MMDLYSFLLNISDKSEFKAELCNRGGYLTFSNSGRRGDVKCFQIGLDNILQTLNDILNNLEIFQNLTIYDETEWRNNGSSYFTDSVAKANSTVQTKPLFSTLSKIILWGNQPNYSDVNTDKCIVLTDESLRNTINKIENVANSFIPNLISYKDCSSLQIIYYGAPGTGKSNTIKGLTNKDNSKRITFHPDSDYASFVGCYKPTVEPIKCGAYKELEELKEEAKTINESPDEKVAQIIAFVTKYANDLQHVVETKPEVGSLQNLLKTYLGFNSNTYLAYVVDYVLKNQKKEITYKFCSQAFTDAYVEAWKDTSKPYYLVIEEINRGNCAQIFGDIFQLLDRGDDGNSSYEITPDKDLQQYLAEKFENEEIVDKDIKDGVKMRLPSNLYILATMNTSDQSLFPIDSAFKRRWDWKYIPIKNEGKNHKIVVGEATYDWWNFVKFVNDRIESVTDSEDKQIGYWFAKANEEGTISAETLVSKVLFYLWNDVFKDYTHNTSSLFQTKKRKYKFREFYLENGDVNIDLLNQFLLELELKNETSQPEETQSTEE